MAFNEGERVYVDGCAGFAGTVQGWAQGADGFCEECRTGAHVPVVLDKDKGGCVIECYPPKRVKRARYVDESEREERDPCEKGTVGCSVLHSSAPDAYTDCETW